MDFIKKLSERGFIYQCSDLEGLKNQKEIVVYSGYDPTGTSLHIGHLVSILMLRQIEKCGHKVIVLLGGGTAMIGDPSFKDSERTLLDEETIKNNINSIQKVFSRYLTNFMLVNNADWLGKLSYIEFLRDISVHFTVNRMMSFESVKLRLEREQPLSLLEFNYMVLQAYDFYHLNNVMNCNLQIGGSDQWGNIINGVELVRRKASKTVYALTCPLVMTASGQKMGKTEKGAVWLDDSLCSPYDFWQYWRNIDDKDVGQFLRFFTDLPIEEIEKLEKLEGSEINNAKKILADETTKMLHGEEVLKTIHESVAMLFEGSKAGIESVPTVELPKGKYRIDDLLVEAGLCTSKGEAKDRLKENAVKIDDVVVSDLMTFIEHEVLLSVGKKKYKRIVMK